MTKIKNCPVLTDRKLLCSLHIGKRCCENRLISSSSSLSLGGGFRPTSEVNDLAANGLIMLLRLSTGISFCIYC